MIENKFIDAVVVKMQGDIFYGIGMANKFYENNPDRLYFGSFKNNIFSLDVGRSIKSFHKINGGYGYSQRPDIEIITFDGGNINLESSISGSGGSSGRDIVLEPVIDYGGSGGKLDLEFDFGGTNNNLDIISHIVLENNEVSFLDFNLFKYKNTANIYYDFNYVFGSQTIWSGYSQNPYYIIKSYPNIQDNEYKDSIVKGVLDYGGSGCIADVNIDFGGTMLKLKFTK